MVSGVFAAGVLPMFTQTTSMSDSFGDSLFEDVR